MRRILVFGEDYGHESVAENLVRRVAQEYDVSIDIVVRSCTGGFGAVMSELKGFSREVVAGLDPLPDMFLVATDANCRGLNARSKEVKTAIPEELVGSAVRMIPDPHVERWLLLDSQAFRAVLGRGCEAPGYKCKRDHYKKLLAQAVADAGVSPQIGGLEYVEDLIRAMDLYQVGRVDRSFQRTISQLRGLCARWSAADTA